MGSGGGTGGDLTGDGLDGLDGNGDVACSSFEEIREWGSSFDRLMHSAAGRKLFREFLVSEYSEENIAFWLACEQLKLERNPERIEEKARYIYEDYISILSPKEVSRSQAFSSKRLNILFAAGEHMGFEIVVNSVSVLEAKRQPPRSTYIVSDESSFCQ